MPKNPERASRGGDVPGETRIDVTMGEAIPVASASYEPGYDLDETFQGGDPANRMTKADLVQGFISFGRLVGERGRR